VDLTGKIAALAKLGKFLEQFTTEPAAKIDVPEKINSRFFEKFKTTIEKSCFENGWFTNESVREAIKGIIILLDENNLKAWSNMYPALEHEPDHPLTVGIIMAGNIPMVGFHDFLAVLLSGNRLVAKTSSKDRHLIPLCFEVLSEIEPGFKDRACFTEDKLTAYDAVIATGSNNSSRYFEYYFSTVPNIIRKNRNSIAVLSGEENEDDLLRLGRDIFTFFGLGCRNITKVYIPADFMPEKLMQAFDYFSELATHNKYANNVDYHRSVYLMNRISFLDNGIVLLKEDTAIASPVGVVFYEKYNDIAILSAQLEGLKDEIQCVVSGISDLSGIPPGSTQTPLPWDYADGVDTLRFLTQLHAR